MKTSNILKTVKPFIAKHEPEILMSMGISSFIFSTIWGIRVALKTKEKIDNYKKSFVGDHPLYLEDNLTKKELFKLLWKDYLPVVIGIGVSIPCIISGNRVANRRNLALAAAYTISETALQEYQEKTKEIIGEKKEKDIHEAISKEKVLNTPGSSTVILSNDGDSLFLEPITGRYFKSNWNKISRIANEINARAISNMSGEITLTDWFYELGLDKTDISDSLGWSTIDGKDGLLSIELDAVLSEDSKPCGAIFYKKLPKVL